MTAIIAFRVYPSLKAQLHEEAAARGKTLSQFLYECIESGWEESRAAEEKVNRAYLSCDIEGIRLALQEYQVLWGRCLTMSGNSDVKR